MANNYFISAGGAGFILWNSLIPPTPIFLDTTERDTYFAANPGELARLDNNEFLIVKVGTSTVTYYNRQESAWVEVTSLVTGPQGEGVVTWAAATSYAEGALVEYNGVLYMSLQGSNVGNQPDNSPAFWSGITTPNITSDEIGISSGSIDLGDSIRVSEGSNNLFVTEFIENTIGSVVSCKFTPAGSDIPKVFELEAEENVITQADDTTNITTNPLFFTIIASANRQVNIATFRTYAAATNVRGKFIHVPSGTVIKYFPSKFAYDQGVNGYTITKIGDIVFNYIDDLPDDIPNGLYYIPSSPFRLIEGDEYQIEFLSDNPFLKGNASDEPYLVIDTQIGIERDLGFGDDAKRNQTTGLLAGGVISIASPTTVSWTAGNGIVTNYSDPNNPIVTKVTWDQVTGYTPTNLATDGTTLFGYDANGDLVETLAPAVTALDTKNYIYFGTATHLSGAIVSINTAPGNLAYDRIGAFKDFINLVIGPANIDGNVYGPNGANLSIDVEGGPAFMLGSNFRDDPQVPDDKPLSSETEISFFKVYREADPSLVMAYDGLPTTFIDPTQYDDGSGTLQTVTSGYWTIQRIFRGRTGQTLVAYGQQEFATKELALEALGDEPFTEKMPLPLTLFRCSLVIAENATDLSDTDQAEFFEQSSFRIKGAVSSSATIPGITAPGGVDRSVQFNNAGVFGGTDFFKYTDSDNFATITLEALTAAGGGALIVNNSSGFQRLNIIYSEVLGKTIIETILNNIEINTDSGLTINYGTSSAVFNDTTGNNTFSIISSASNKDVSFSLQNYLNNDNFIIEHNDVSDQTSLIINNDAGNDKFSITYNSTLDDVFLSTGNSAPLNITSAGAIFVTSAGNITLDTVSNHTLTFENDQAVLAIKNAANNYVLSYTNTLANTVPLMEFSKTGTNGGAFRIFTSTVTPEGAITGIGGDICVLDSGTSSEIFIKLTDSGNTGWQKLLHGTSGVQGPLSSTDNAIAVWDGTTGLLLQDSFASVVSDANNTQLFIDNVSSSGQSGLRIRNNSLATRFAITYNQALGDVFLSSVGADLYHISSGSLTLESNNIMLIETLGNYAISMKNDNAIFNINSSGASYSFGFSNQEPSTDPLFIWAKDDVSGGVCRVYLRNATPEGVITAAGGSLCIRSSGTSSNIYLKLSDATNTDWQSLLGDVIGPATSTDSGLALFDGTTGKLLKSASNITVSESPTINEILFKLPSGGTNNQITFENFAGSRLTLFEFDDLAIQTTLYSSGTSHSLVLQADGEVKVRSFNDFDITLSNNNASYSLFNSTQNYLHRIQNNQPNTNALIRFVQTGTNGGQSQFYFSTVSPEGVITGNGGDICIVDAGTSSDIYLKRSDASNTGWVDLLHSNSGVQGPVTSTNTAIATWNGTDGLTLNDSYAFLSSDANNTRLSIDNVSISGQSGIQIRNHLSETRYSVIYNQTLGDIFVTTALGINYDVSSNGRINMSALSSAAFGSSANENVTISNDNATLLINDSAQNYRFDFTNNQPNTNTLIRFTQTGTNGGSFNLHTSTVSPEGNITASGGDLCLVSSGISSDLYIKRTDTGNTGWTDFLHGSSGVQGPVTSTNNALAVWDGTDGLTLQDSYTSLVSSASSTVLSVKNVSATGQSGFAIQNSFGFDRYSLTYDQTTNAVFMTTNSGTSYSNVVDGSLEHLSNSNIAIGSSGNQTVEFYNINATLRVDISANGGRLFFSNTAADTAEMIRLFKTGTNGGATEIYVTSRTPTGNITGNGGDLAIRDAGTSSNVYIKRVDGGTTGWNVALTSPVETSTLNAIPSFDVTTGNSLSPVNTATVSADTTTTTLQLRPVTSDGNAEIDFRTSSGLIRTQFYYDEDVNTTNLEANTAKLNIGNYGGAISFLSATGDTDLYIRTSSPSGSLVGNYGDLAIDISSNPSMYLNTGDARIWSRFSLDSDTDMYGGPGRLQNRLRWSEDLSNAVWLDGLGNTTITTNNQTAPNGELTADTVQWDSSGLGLRQLFTKTTGNVYTVSFWAKLLTGTNNGLVLDIGDGDGVVVYIGAEWHRVSTTITAGSGGNWFDITHYSTSSFAIWGFQINDGTEAYPYLKTEDLSKTGVDEYGLSVDGKIIFDKADTDNIITNLGTGVCCGGLLSVNGVDDTLLDVTAGNALIADYSIPNEPYIRRIYWDNQTIDPDLTTSWNKWVGVQESSTAGVGEFVFSSDFTQLEKRTVAIVGRAWTDDTITANIIGVGQYTTPSFGQAYTANDLSYIFGSINKYGNTYSASGANLLLTKSAGITFRFGAGWATTPESSNVHIDNAQPTVSAYYYILSSSTSATVLASIDPNNYDNGGTKTTVPTGKYTLQRIYYFPVSQVCMVTYGQTLYNSMAEAIGEAGRDIVDVEEDLIEGSILRGWIALEQGATDLSNISEALFKEARSVSEPAAKGAVGTNYTLKSYALADVGSEDTSYAAGFYEYATTSSVLTIGGTATQVFGTANKMIGAHAFIVASGPGGTDLVLTVSGTSITDDGVLTTSDSEIIVPDTDQATTNQYFETTKKWLGQITYTLTGTTGSFTFNYGFTKYEDFGNRDFTVQDFEIVGKAAANSSANLLVLFHHSPTGFTYAATGFKPFPTVIASNVNDLSTYRNFVGNEYFSYKRTNLAYSIAGSENEGIIIEYTQPTNNPIYYANIHMGVLI